MSTYRLRFSLPGIPKTSSPQLAVTVEASNEDEALDAGFDEAFRTYPEFGAFQLDEIAEIK
jgi:hypothetical protein